MHLKHRLDQYFSRVHQFSSPLCAAITNTKECGIGIKLPEEILSVAAGLSRQVNVTRTTEVSQECTVSWSLQSEVTVPPHCVTSAELVLLE